MVMPGMPKVAGDPPAYRWRVPPTVRVAGSPYGRLAYLFRK